MKNLIIIGILFLVVSFGCQDMKERETTSMLSGQYSSDTLFLIQKGPFHFSLKVPKDLVKQELPFIQYLESTGKLTIKIGDGFMLLVSQEIKSISEIREKLMSDEILIASFEESSDNHLLYKQSLPFGKDYSWHCKYLVMETQLPYFIESSSTRQFTLDQVRVMLNSIQSISPL